MYMKNHAPRVPQSIEKEIEKEKRKNYRSCDRTSTCTYMYM